MRDSLTAKYYNIKECSTKFFTLICGLLLITAVTGCQRKSNFKINPLTFDIDSVGQGKVKFIKGLSLINLSIPNERISYIDKLYSTDKYIIIFDKYSSRVSVFDHRGKHLRDIGTPKSSLGEKPVINDVNFYEETNEVEIFSLPERKLKIYDLEGTLKREISSKYDFLTMHKTKDGYWVYGCFESNIKRSLFTFTRNKSNLLLLSEDLQSIKESYCESENFYDRLNSNDNFHTNSRGELYFNYGFSDIIYRIEGKDVQPAIYLNYGLEKLPYDHLKTITNRKEFDDEVYTSKQLYPGYKTRLQIGDSHISFISSYYTFGFSDQYSVICSMIDGKMKLSGISAVTKQPLLSNPVGISNGKMFFMINPLTLNAEDKEMLNANYDVEPTEFSTLLFYTDEKNVI